MDQKNKKPEIVMISEKVSDGDFVNASYTEKPVVSLLKDVLGTPWEFHVHQGFLDSDKAKPIYLVFVNGNKIHVPDFVEFRDIPDIVIDMIMKQKRADHYIKKKGGYESFSQQIAELGSKTFSIHDCAKEAGLCDAGVAGLKKHLGVIEDLIPFSEVAKASSIDKRILLPAAIAYKQLAA